MHEQSLPKGDREADGAAWPHVLPVHSKKITPRLIKAEKLLLANAIDVLNQGQEFEPGEHFDVHIGVTGPDGREIIAIRHRCLADSWRRLTSAEH